MLICPNDSVVRIGSIKKASGVARPKAYQWGMESRWASPPVTHHVVTTTAAIVPAVSKPIPRPCGSSPSGAMIRAANGG